MTRHRRLSEYRAQRKATVPQLAKRRRALHRVEGALRTTVAIGLVSLLLLWDDLYKISTGPTLCALTIFICSGNLLGRNYGAFKGVVSGGTVGAIVGAAVCWWWKVVVFLAFSPILISENEEGKARNVSELMLGVLTSTSFWLDPVCAFTPASSASGGGLGSYLNASSRTIDNYAVPFTATAPSSLSAVYEIGVAVLLFCTLLVVTMQKMPPLWDRFAAIMSAIAFLREGLLGSTTPIYYSMFTLMQLAAGGVMALLVFLLPFPRTAMSKLNADSELAARYLTEAYSLLMSVLTEEVDVSRKWERCGVLLNATEKVVRDLRVYQNVYVIEPRLSFLSFEREEVGEEGHGQGNGRRGSEKKTWKWRIRRKRPLVTTAVAELVRSLRGVQRLCRTLHDHLSPHLVHDFPQLWKDMRLSLKGCAVEADHAVANGMDVVIEALQHDRCSRQFGNEVELALQRLDAAERNISHEYAHARQHVIQDIAVAGPTTHLSVRDILHRNQVLFSCMAVPRVVKELLSVFKSDTRQKASLLPPGDTRRAFAAAIGKICKHSMWGVAGLPGVLLRHRGLPFLKRVASNWRSLYSTNEGRSGIRRGVATLLASLFLFIPQFKSSFAFGIWSALAVLSVMDESIGSSWVRGKQRLQGTAIGVAYAYTAVTLGGAGDDGGGLNVGNVVGLGISVLVISFFASMARNTNTYMTGGLTTGTTALLILFNGYTLLSVGKNGYIQILTAERVQQNFIGITLAITSLVLLWPKRASQNFGDQLKKAVEKVCAVFDTVDDSYLSPIAGEHTAVPSSSHHSTPPSPPPLAAERSGVEEVEAKISQTRRECEAQLGQLDACIADALGEPPFFKKAFPTNRALAVQDDLSDVFRLTARFDFILRGLMSDELLTPGNPFEVVVDEHEFDQHALSYRGDQSAAILDMRRDESSNSLIVVYASRFHFLFGSLFSVLQQLRASISTTLHEVAAGVGGDSARPFRIPRNGSSALFEESMVTDADEELGVAPALSPSLLSRRLLHEYGEVMKKARGKVHASLSGIKCKVVEDVCLSKAETVRLEDAGVLPRPRELIAFNALVGNMLDICTCLARLEDSCNRYVIASAAD
uniref:Integral membrane bound transporter domain-containing protein n=1 Tax=Palpitomonas bilix TaxID=652834 RepID=A0A7S3D412_9EUKA|mmetsp:Transcript_20989/g.54208  ORF Transcript_20989/g.54208 Transcript_20989/m.54208 type:complete len:1099 (+) Transcript_20989:149-3445(+)